MERQKIYLEHLLTRLKLSGKGGGILYEHPHSKTTSIRIMPGQAHAERPWQRIPYVI
jgi:hypothetical protein